MAKAVSERKAEIRRRGIEYAYDLINSYRRYHDHKERMTYVAFAVYLGYFFTSLVAREWPFSAEQTHHRALTILGLSLIWLFALVYMKWQLRNRRVAAIYVAALQELLAKWVADPPDVSQLRVGRPKKRSHQAQPAVIRRLSIWQARLERAIDYLVPINLSSIGGDVDLSKYPRAIADAIEERFSEGTGALFQERLLILLGWSVYFGIVIRALLGDVADDSSSAVLIGGDMVDPDSMMQGPP